MVSVVVCLAVFNATINMAAALRQLFAFARDHGFPFRKFFAHVPQRRIIKEVPLNAIVLICVIASLLAVINVGSTIAYNQIVSTGLAALVSSYIVSTSCTALKRLRGEPLLDAYFTLGKGSLPVYLIAVGFTAMAFVMSFFPPVRNPAPSKINWAILVYGVVVVCSMVYYVAVGRHGRHRYKGPVAYVKRLE